MKKYYFIMLIILMALCSVTGCNQEADLAEKTEERSEQNEIASNDLEIYNVGFGGDWGYPAPYSILPRGPGFVLLQLTFDSLTWKNEGGELVPQLAKSWSYDEENKQYNFTLNDGIKWHDGRQLTAKDVEFTVEYMQKNPLPWLDLSMVEEVKVLNDYEVAFLLNQDYAPFYNMVVCGMPILPKHIYGEIEHPMSTVGLEICVGSGPYIIKEYSPEEGLYAFEAFDDYHGGDIRVKKLNFIAYSPEMQVPALMRGEVDMIMPSSDMLSKIKEAGFSTQSSLGMITKLRYNTDKFPFNQVEFRQAIAYAIDATELINIAQRGYAYEGAVGVISPTSSFYYGDVEDYDCDLEQVERLMISLGYEKEAGYYALDGTILEVALLGYDRVKRDVEVIAAQLNAAGFKTKAIYKDMATCDQQLINGAYDLSVTEDGAFGDPMYLNRMIYSDVGENFRQNNKALVEAVNDQVKAKDKVVRKEILKTVQKLYSKSLPSYALYYSQMNAAYNDKVDVYFTEEGYGIGVTLPFNKLMYVQ